MNTCMCALIHADCHLYIYTFKYTIYTTCMHGRYTSLKYASPLSRSYIHTRNSFPSSSFVNYNIFQRPHRPAITISIDEKIKVIALLMISACINIDVHINLHMQICTLFSNVQFKIKHPHKKQNEGLC